MAEEVIRGAVGTSVSSSSTTTIGSTWQERLIEASVMGMIRIKSHDSNIDHVDAATDGATTAMYGGDWGPTFFDNTSSGMFCMPCSDDNINDDKPLWWLVLQWLKMMLFKVARTYTGKPVLLMMFPLSVGLCIGYLIGRRHSGTTTTNYSQQAIQRKESSLYSMAMSWLSKIIIICIYPLYMIRKGHMLQPTVQVNAQTEKNENHEETSSSSFSCTSSLTKVEMEELAAAEIRLKKDDPNLIAREETARTNFLKGEEKEDDTTTTTKTRNYLQQESGIDPSKVPRHVAVIMDGNRRYGRERYGNATRGHWEGSSKLVDFARWCIAEHISVLTVYAFSTENWNRQPDEVAALMSIFTRYCDELRVEALQRNIKILVLSTDSAKIPSHVRQGMERMVKETKNCNGLTMNICISYGSRGEIVAASKSLASDIARGNLDYNSIDEIEFQKRLLTSHCGDPDVLIRTSGEIRISNFLLWQLAYTEMFFVDKPWPAIEKDDLINVIKAFADGRKRRFGL